jgi:hypothetical protein
MAAFSASSLPIQEAGGEEVDKPGEEENASSIVVDELPAYNSARGVWTCQLHLASGRSIEVDANRAIPRLRKLSPERAEPRLDKAERRAVADLYRQERREKKRNKRRSRKKASASNSSQPPASTTPTLSSQHSASASDGARDGSAETVGDSANGERESNTHENDVPEHIASTGLSTLCEEASQTKEPQQEDEQLASQLQQKMQQKQQAVNRMFQCSERLLRSTFAEVLMDPALKNEAREMLRPSAPPPGFGFE